MVPVCGHGIASVMLSLCGPLKAEFRNGILGVLVYQKETRQRVLFRKEIASQNSWKTTELKCKSSDADVDVVIFF